MIIEVSGNWTTQCLITTYCSYFEIAEFSQYQYFIDQKVSLLKS